MIKFVLRLWFRPQLKAVELALAPVVIYKKFRRK